MKRFFALFAALTLFCTGISAQTAACRTETGIAYRDAAEAACMMIEDGADAAMNHYNRKNKENS